MAQPLFQIRALLIIITLVGNLSLRADQIIYADALTNSWQDWSWATVSLANSAPVHSGSKSISVTAGNWSALYLGVTAMDVSAYTNLAFWVNGGAIGGQTVQVQAILGSTWQAAIQIGPLPTNAWRQINLSMSALGISGAANFTGFWVQCETANALPTFFLDDITLQSGPPTPPVTNAAVTVTVDAFADRHVVSPLIYGVCYATSNQLQDLNAPLNRSGGNSTSRYNWQTNGSNHANDWYFESLAEAGSGPGAAGDSFIRESKTGGAQPMVSIPIIGWVAKLGSNSGKLASYSIAKYGAQTGSDSQWMPDAGNGILASTGVAITNNDPTDANLAVTTNFQAGWIEHLTNTWGTAAGGGMRYYIMDNEWSLWHSTHRDVHPVGATMDEVLGKFSDYATLVKSIDPNALIAGPEEWNWPGYFYSGYDQQWSGARGDYNPAHYPDRTAHGGQDFAPWFLAQVKQRGETAGKRLVDVFTLHCYPQGGEALNNDVSAATQLLRNRSTRQLWDTNYVDQSWINSAVMLIPRMKAWVATNYPGTLTGITEYNWGADDYMNGATAQADILGIFGREGLDLATRWTCPNTGTPAYNAFKIFRNYDGGKSTFGHISVRTTAPNPDNLAAFSAVRTNDAALTVLVINKSLINPTPVVLALANYPAPNSAQVWQFNSSNIITRLADTPVSGGVISNLLPAQSLTLFIVPAAALKLSATRMPPNAVNLQFDCITGMQHITEVSSNLKVWQPFATNTPASNQISIVIIATNTAPTFFRAKFAP